MAFAEQKKNGSFSNLANPVLRRLDANAERNADEVCTYGGIIGKTIYFMLVTVAGVLLTFILHNILLGVAGSSAIHIADAKNGIYDFWITPAEMGIMTVVGLVSIIVPFLAWFIRKTIPVTGTIYCVCQGMLVGFITVALAPEFKNISFLALLITVGLVAAMLFVYSKRIIKVTARFRGVISAIFLSIVIAGVIYLIMYLIPGIRNSEIFSGIIQTFNSPALTIGISIVFVIIAALFMLADFDTIERCVTQGADKKYEWMAAWGLAYTILYIYFKILRILLTIFGNRSSSSK